MYSKKVSYEFLPCDYIEASYEAFPTPLDDN